MENLRMYTTPWCGYCKVLKRGLTQAGVAYTEINIEEHPEAAAHVREVNGGNETVPTILYPDGTSATNPRTSEVVAKLAAL